RSEALREGLELAAFFAFCCPQRDTLVAGCTDGKGTVTQEGQSLDRSRGTEVAGLAECRGVPEMHGPIVRAGGPEFALRCEGDRVDPLPTPEYFRSLLARLHVPEACCATGPAAQQGLAIGSERDTADFSLVAEEPPQLLAGR